MGSRPLRMATTAAPYLSRAVLRPARSSDRPVISRGTLTLLNPKPLASSMYSSTSRWKRLCADRTPVSCSGYTTRSAPTAESVLPWMSLMARAITWGTSKVCFRRTVVRTLDWMSVPMATAAVSKLRIPTSSRNSMEVESPVTE